MNNAFLKALPPDYEFKKLRQNVRAIVRKNNPGTFLHISYPNKGIDIEYGRTHPNQRKMGYGTEIRKIVRNAANLVNAPVYQEAVNLNKLVPEGFHPISAHIMRKLGAVVKNITPDRVKMKIPRKSKRNTPKYHERYEKNAATLKFYNPKKRKAYLINLFKTYGNYNNKDENLPLNQLEKKLNSLA